MNSSAEKKKNIKKPIEKVYKVRITSSSNRNLEKFLHVYSTNPYVETGYCSYYNNSFHGKKTATGDIFFQERLTCAHKTLPLPCIVLMTFLQGGKLYGMKLLVNDRGPYVKGRILDVSEEVAKTLNFQKAGCIKIFLILLPYDTQNLLKTGKFSPLKTLLDLKAINMILLENNVDFFQI
jgi:rare lipoprotein A